MRLDRNWIEGNIPHHGRMCLLDEVIEWDTQHIRCRSGTHRLPDNPLRSHGRLGSACGIEYAAQAMAVHGALIGGALLDSAAADGATSVDGANSADRTVSAGGATMNTRPDAGFLAALRNVRLHVPRLDDIAADLICDVRLVAGDQGTALYEFAVMSELQRLLSGRATVVFDAKQKLKL